MPLIRATIPDKIEGEAAPEGEYDLHVIDFVSLHSDKTDRDGFQARIRIVDGDYPNANMIFENFWLPKDGDEPDKAIPMMRNLIRFLTVAEVPHERLSEGLDFEPEDVKGAEFRCGVKHQHDDFRDEEVNQLRLPRVKE